MGRGKVGLVHHCPHRGCRVQYVIEKYARLHAAEPHFACKCGRLFTARGLTAHLGQQKRWWGKKCRAPRRRD